MRHQKAGKKLNRTGSHRNAMFRNMVTSLFNHGRIRTTDAKAKELRRWAEHVITLAKRGDLHARRQALAVMRDPAAVHKLFEEVQGRFGQRAGGYTRIVKIGQRTGDAAPVSLVEFVTEEQKQKRRKKPKTTKKEVTKVKKGASVTPKAEEEAEPKKDLVSEEKKKEETAPFEERADEEQPQGDTPKEVDKAVEEKTASEMKKDQAAELSAEETQQGPVKEEEKHTGSDKEPG
jgi:large subunit ribosomal protein L17